jgi:hypothetical protein
MEARIAGCHLATHISCKRIRIVRGLVDQMNSDISPNFKGPSVSGDRICRAILRYEGTAQALNEFMHYQDDMDDHMFWFLLGTLWVSYSGRTDIYSWRRLFASKRPLRSTSLMKPSELLAFNALAGAFVVYRAARHGELDWMSCTTDLRSAERMLSNRPNGKIIEMVMQKCDCMAYFLRRGEFEVLVPDQGGRTIAAGLIR